MIDCHDILRGYVKNFHGLNLNFFDSRTKITRKVLHYFTELGEILGYYVAIEEYHRQDLVWEFARKQDSQWILHLETEGEHGIKRNLEKTFPRLEKSNSRMKIAIMYSKMQEIENEILVYKKKLENWNLESEEEIMLIVSDWLEFGPKKAVFNKENHPLIILHKTGITESVIEIRGHNWKVDENDLMYIKTESE